MQLLTPQAKPARDSVWWVVLVGRYPPLYQPHRFRWYNEAIAPHGSNPETNKFRGRGSYESRDLAKCWEVRMCGRSAGKIFRERTKGQSALYKISYFKDPESRAFEHEFFALNDWHARKRVKNILEILKNKHENQVEISLLCRICVLSYNAEERRIIPFKISFRD
jgi:hypothetical protein